MFLNNEKKGTEIYNCDLPVGTAFSLVFLSSYLLA